MKKLFTSVLFLLISALIFATGTVTTSGTGDGFSGKIKVDVVTNGEKIEDIKLVSDSETSHIISRAFPILKERILKAQSPVIDSVSGASYTSFGVKKAVAEALKANGKDFGRIRFNTKAPEQPVANLEAVNTDLVIVGGGPAGLAAAISAREAGLKNIILIEKMDILSGNGKYDMNFYDLINSEAQKARGINDTVESLIADNSNPLDTPERIKAQAEGSFILDQWLRSFGVKLNYNYGKRGHMAEADAYAGAHVQDGMENKVKELGIDVRTGTKGLDLIMNDGKAAGVKVQNGNNFYDINAKAVILATGGFSANKELLKKYVPGSEVFQTSNQIGATGDFIPVFEKNNIKTANLEVLNIFPFIIRQTRDLTGGGDGFVLVNKDGKRFTSESITYATRFATAQKILDQPDSAVFYISDQKLYDSSFRLQKHTAQGLHTKAATLDELADKLGIDKANLKSTVEEFNKAVRGEIKDPFREKPTKKEFMSEGPYYGVQVESAIHMTKGGVAANEKAEVLHKDGHVVKGLYAAGEVTNTTGAYSAAVVFGRIAGQEAAKYINK